MAPPSIEGYIEPLGMTDQNPLKTALTVTFADNGPAIVQC